MQLNVLAGFVLWTIPDDRPTFYERNKKILEIVRWSDHWPARYAILARYFVEKYR